MKLTQEEVDYFPEFVYNAIQTPDGTILHSAYRHDYKECVDKNGETYMLDGGNHYYRSSVNKEKAKDISVRISDNISLIREHYTWGTYGKDGSNTLTPILLKDMSNSHIQAIIKDGYVASPIMELELQYRKANGIVVED